MFFRFSSMFKSLFPNFPGNFPALHWPTTRHDVEHVAADVGDRRVARASADQLGPFRPGTEGQGAWVVPDGVRPQNMISSSCIYLNLSLSLSLYIYIEL